VREGPDCGVELWTVEAAERIGIHTDDLIVSYSTNEGSI